ncbi:hypothetical protein GCM10027594_12790 [Hymenobacter agri]
MLLLALTALLGSRPAQGQITLSNFKIDNSTSFKFYTTTAASRTATFTVQASRPISSGDIPNVRIFLVGYNPEQWITTTTTGFPSWTYNSNGTAMIATITGSFQLSYAATGGGLYTGLQIANMVGINTGSRSSIIPITFISNPNTAITLSNFRISDPTTNPNNGLSVNVNSVPRTVTASVSLSKDPGYTDEFAVQVRGNNTGLISSTTTSSSAWTLTSAGQKTCTVSWSFSVSTANVPIANTQFTTVATSAVPTGYLLGTGTSTVAINRVADPPSTPCISDVFVQNVTFSGNKASGQNLYAGRAVTTSTANGDVTILTSTAATFTARKQIGLLDGFSARPGSTFSAFLDGAACSTFAPGDTSSAPSYRQAMAGDKILAPLQATQLEDRVTSKPQETASVYPNPAHDVLNIQLPNNGSARVVHIYNSIGYEVQRVVMQPEQTAIDVRALPAGVYNLLTTSESGTIKTLFRVSR